MPALVGSCAGRLYWGLQVMSYFEFRVAFWKGGFERGIIWKAQITIEGALKTSILNTVQTQQNPPCRAWNLSLHHRLGGQNPTFRATTRSSGSYPTPRSLGISRRLAAHLTRFVISFIHQFRSTLLRIIPGGRMRGILRGNIDQALTSPPHPPTHPPPIPLT